LEIKDVIFQKEFNFTGKESNYYAGKEMTFVPRDLTVSIQCLD